MAIIDCDKLYIQKARGEVKKPCGIDIERFRDNNKCQMKRDNFSFRNTNGAQNREQRQHSYVCTGTALS